jgi:hypothetical protein
VTTKWVKVNYDSRYKSLFLAYFPAINAAAPGNPGALAMSAGLARRLAGRVIAVARFCENDRQLKRPSPQ